MIIILKYSVYILWLFSERAGLHGITVTWVRVTVSDKAVLHFIPSAYLRLIEYIIVISSIIINLLGTLCLNSKLYFLSNSELRYVNTLVLCIFSKLNYSCLITREKLNLTDLV